MPFLLRVWRILGLLDTPTLLVGGVATATRHRWGAYLLIGYVVIRIGFHATVGAWGYRDVMRRPWPKVRPLDDDDWDD
jgi:hypothetical protein